MQYEDADFVDRVAQAVIDRIEERDTVNGLVNLVVARVIELQKEAREEAELLAAAQANTEPASAESESEENEDSQNGR